MAPDWKYDPAWRERYYYDYTRYEYVYESGRRFNQDGYQVYSPLSENAENADESEDVQQSCSEEGSSIDEGDEEDEESYSENPGDEKGNTNGLEVDYGTIDDADFNSDFTNLQISTPDFDASEAGSISPTSDVNTMLFQPEHEDEGRYRIGKELGKGAQGAVYECYDMQDGKVYALKVYSLDSHPTKSHRTQIYQEVALMAELSSQHQAQLYIVRLIRWHEDSTEISLIMSPMASGGNLAALLRSQFRSLGQEVLSWDFIESAMLNLSAGLAWIHQESIRHKDIKPWNILIHNGRALYTDFGISIVFDRSVAGDDGLSLARAADMHTYNNTYTAPELLEEEGTRTTKADVFSLGCVFWDMLAARTVYLTGEPQFGKKTVLNKGFREFNQEYGTAAKCGAVQRALLEAAGLEVWTGCRRFFNLVEEMIQVHPDPRPDVEWVRRQLFGPLY